MILQEFIIGNVNARKIMDSRGSPTIEVESEIYDRSRKVRGFGTAAAPSGASRGINEVTYMPEGGVDEAISRFDEINQKLKGKTFYDQRSFDEKCRELDETKDLRKLGGNTIVALSMSILKAIASAKGEQVYKQISDEKEYKLPYPLGNVIGGGEHAGHKAPDIQEFLILPVGADGFRQAAFGNARVHDLARSLILKKDNAFTGGKGDEGGWAPNLNDHEALEIIKKACSIASNELGFEIRMGLDVAASSIYDVENMEYNYVREGETRDTGEQIDYMLELIDSYNLFYVEDPVYEEDFESFAEIREKAGGKCLICGDDIFVTSVERIKRGIDKKSANSVLIKPNQIGTLTDTERAVKLTREKIGVPVMSHRSGETTDTTISHLAVGYKCPIIKTGIVGGERIAKINEIMRIEDELGEKAKMSQIR